MNQSMRKTKREQSLPESVKVKQDLIAAVNSVRSKYKALKRGEDVTSRELERTFQPVVDPLQKLLTKIKPEEDEELKSQFKIEKNSRRSRLSQFLESPSPARKKFSYSTPKRASPFETNESFSSDVFGNVSTPKDSRTIIRSPEYFDTPRPSSSASAFRRLSTPATSKSILSNRRGGPLATQYLQGMIKDTSKEYDHKFGVYENPVTGLLMLGREPIDFGLDDTIFLAGSTIKGTVGLFELLFKQSPKQELIKDQDKINWKNLLSKSYAHKQKYDPQLNLASSNNRKYIDFIKPLFKPGSLSTSPQFELSRKTRRTSSAPSYGKGVVRLTKNKIDYIHWNNPDELVDRLRLLLASQQAGHQGHDLEIHNILEELREAGIIY